MVSSLASLKAPLANIRELSCNRGGGGHHRADQVRASASPLSAFKVSIAGRGATLARLQDVRVHSQTHRTAALAPFKTCVEKDAIKPFGFGGALDCLRAWHNHRPHILIDPIASHHTRRRSQIFDARVRARADEDAINRNLFNV